MKTSFYFVLWILIYPILGLFNNNFIDNNDFIIALAFVWGLSWLLNRMMNNIMTYERASQLLPILEDVYTGNISAFKKRLSRETTLTIIVAIYFVVTTIAISFTIFNGGINNWIALIVFGIFGVGNISRSYNLVKAKSKLNRNPTTEQCREIAEDTYDLNYSDYYLVRSDASCSEMLPPKPRFFRLFKICSLIFAVAAFLLGLIYIALAIMIFITYSSVEAGTNAGMLLLYGSLAGYYGVKDFISCLRINSLSRTEKV